MTIRPSIRTCAAHLSARERSPRRTGRTRPYLLQDSPSPRPFLGFAYDYGKRPHARNRTRRTPQPQSPLFASFFTAIPPCPAWNCGPAAGSNYAYDYQRALILGTSDSATYAYAAYDYDPARPRGTGILPVFSMINYAVACPDPNGVGDAKSIASATINHHPSTIPPATASNPSGNHSETGMYYYGYRYYFPELGRWPNRDPIGEIQGGLYLFCLNNGISLFDYLGLAAAFYAAHDGDAGILRLAAEEQAVHISDKKSIDAQINNRLAAKKFYGPLFEKQLPVVAFSKGANDAALQILKEKGSVLIYAHGLGGKGYVSTGAEHITSDHIRKAFQKQGQKHSLDYIWALSCQFGLKGEAKRWAEELDVPKGVVGYMGNVDMAVDTYTRATIKGALIHGAAISATFGQLITNLRNRTITYEVFEKQWQATYEKYHKEKCIRYAFWHAYVKDYTKFQNFSKRPFDHRSLLARKPLVRVYATALAL